MAISSGMMERYTNLSRSQLESMRGWIDPNSLMSPNELHQRFMEEVSRQQNMDHIQADLMRYKYQNVGMGLGNGEQIRSQHAGQIAVDAQKPQYPNGYKRTLLLLTT